MYVDLDWRLHTVGFVGQQLTGGVSIELFVLARKCNITLTFIKGKKN